MIKLIIIIIKIFCTILALYVLGLLALIGLILWDEKVAKSNILEKIWGLDKS